MATESGDLYRKVVLEHNRNPRNFGALATYTHHAVGQNPLCGDRVEIFLAVAQQQIQQVGFVGEGCAICLASASLLTESIQHKTLTQIEPMFSSFASMLAGHELSAMEETTLGPLQVFAGVAAYPSRIKCAMLAWKTLQAALARSGELVSTE